MLGFCSLICHHPTQPLDVCSTQLMLLHATPRQPTNELAAFQSIHCHNEFWRWYHAIDDPCNTNAYSCIVTVFYKPNSNWYHTCPRVGSYPHVFIDWSTLFCPRKPSIRRHSENETMEAQLRLPSSKTCSVHNKVIVAGKCSNVSVSLSFYHWTSSDIILNHQGSGISSAIVLPCRHSISIF